MTLNLRGLKRPGTYLDIEEKVILELAVEYQRIEDPCYSVVSWENQEKALIYFTEHGFIKTLTFMLELREAGGSHDS